MKLVFFPANFGTKMFMAEATFIKETFSVHNRRGELDVY